MTRRTVQWTKELTDHTAAAFNAGESHSSIGLRMGISTKAVAEALRRGRQGKPGTPAISTVRRFGPSKKGPAQ